MIVVNGSFLLKPDKFDEGLKIINSHKDFGIKHQGCLDGFVTQNKEKPNEVLIYTKWEDEGSYQQMNSALKKSPKAAMDFLKLIGMLAEQPKVTIYNVLE